MKLAKALSAISICSLGVLIVAGSRGAQAPTFVEVVLAGDYLSALRRQLIASPNLVNNTVFRKQIVGDEHRDPDIVVLRFKMVGDQCTEVYAAERDKIIWTKMDSVEGDVKNLYLLATRPQSGAVASMEHYLDNPLTLSHVTVHHDLSTLGLATMMYSADYDDTVTYSAGWAISEHPSSAYSASSVGDVARRVYEERTLNKLKAILSHDGVPMAGKLFVFGDRALSSDDMKEVDLDSAQVSIMTIGEVRVAVTFYRGIVVATQLPHVLTNEEARLTTVNLIRSAAQGPSTPLIYVKGFK